MVEQSDISGVILGTAQLASSYGVLQQSVERSGERPSQFLDAAWRLGIHTFDTAPRYGEAEVCLGQLDRPITIHTKIDPNVSPEESIMRSLARLSRSSVEIAYLHDPDAAIREGGKSVDEASTLIGDAIEYLGVSVYELHQLTAGIEHPAVSVVQIPINPLSRRLADEACRRRPNSVRVVGRSLFAQGVLLLEPALLPRQVSHLAATILEFRALCEALGRSIDEVLLLWSRDFPGIDGVVVGAVSEMQLRRIVECLSAVPLSGDERSLVDDWSMQHEIDADPRMWG